MPGILCEPVRTNLEQFATSESVRNLARELALDRDPQGEHDEEWILVHWFLHELPDIVGESFSRHAAVESIRKEWKDIARASAGIQDLHYFTQILAEEGLGVPEEDAASHMQASLGTLLAAAHVLGHASRDLRARGLKCAIAGEYSVGHILLRVGLESSVRTIFTLGLGVGSIRSRMEFGDPPRKLNRVEVDARLPDLLELPYRSLVTSLGEWGILPRSHSYVEVWDDCNQFVHQGPAETDYFITLEASTPVCGAEARTNLDALRVYLKQLKRANDLISEGYLTALSWIPWTKLPGRKWPPEPEVNLSALVASAGLTGTVESFRRLVSRLGPQSA